MIKVRMPGNLDVPTRFFGRFTPHDIARISLPIGVAYLLELPVIALVTGVVLGVGLYLIRPHGKPLDRHTYHVLRWLVARKGLEGSDIRKESEDHIITSTGTVVGIIRVEPCNLEMKTEAEQHALHHIYREVLETVSYPVKIYSRQQQYDLEDYIQEIENEEPKRLFDSYKEYCQELAKAELVSTQHYIVVQVNPEAREWIQDRIPRKLAERLLQTNGKEGNEAVAAQVSELDSRCRQILEEINTGDLRAERVTGRELTKLAQDCDQIKPRNTPTWNTREIESRGRYSRTLNVTELPSTTELGWTVPVLRTPGKIDVTQTIEPQKPSETTNSLHRIIEKLNAEIDSFLASGYRGTNKLETLLNDAEWMLQLLADREEQPVKYGAYITVHDRERGDCLRTYERVKNRLETMQIEYREPVFQTDQALKTRSPLKPDALDSKLLMPSGSAAGGFPFATQDTGSNGVIYGLDSSDETPVLLDRFTWESHSMARMGTVGSGKSFAAKLEILRTYLRYDDIKIIVVDPKQEYSHVINTLDGTTYTLGKDEYSFENQVISFEVEERGQDNVPELTQAVQDIYTATSQDTQKTLVLIDEARILLNDDKGLNVLNQFVLEGRDTNTAITLVTQNASHFSHSRKGREILDNMPGKVFMKHERVPDDVIEYFHLSQREVQQLYELKTGTDSEYSEAIVKISGRLDTKLRVEATPQEKAIIEAGGENR